MPTPNRLGLVVLTRELIAQPILDPLNFKTNDGKDWSYTAFLKGERFPDHSFFQDMHFSIWADLDGVRLVAMEDYASAENGFVTLSRAGQEIYKISTGHGSPVEALRGLWAVDHHWVLETAFVTERDENNVVYTDARGQIVEDGQSLNDTYGYDETFGFQTIQGKPFYFFKKDGRFQAWYDGQVIPLGYEAIPHYGCCSSGELNPYNYKDRVAFFGTRGGTWYFVQIGTPSSIQLGN